MTIRGWGEVLRHFHIYLGSEHFFGQNTFVSMKICGYIFLRGGGGHYEIGLFFLGGGGGWGFISIHFRAF